MFSPGVGGGRERAENKDWLEPINRGQEKAKVYVEVNVNKSQNKNKIKCKSLDNGQGHRKEQV